MEQEKRESRIKLGKYRMLRDGALDEDGVIVILEAPVGNHGEIRQFILGRARNGRGGLVPDKKLKLWMERCGSSPPGRWPDRETLVRDVETATGRNTPAVGECREDHPPEEDIGESDGERDVLVFPGRIVEGCGEFTPWADLTGIIPAIEREAVWMPRDRAEESGYWVQLVPCAVITEPGPACHAFRRITQRRPNLSSRISLVVGGHVERQDWEGSLIRTVHFALRREMAEELKTGPVESLRTAGLIIDRSTERAARHMALAHEAAVTGPVEQRAPEEFRPDLDLDGTGFRSKELLRFRPEMDPWSRIILDNHILGR